MKNNYKLKTRLGFLLTCFILTISISVKSQVTVAGSTGANGTYTKLKIAFDSINAHTTQTGNTITISITANTTEIAPAVLNQPTGGSWTSLTISPSGGAAITVTGSLPAPIVSFNGADNVTIDGLNTGGNSLTISNTSTSSASPTSTILFIADATNNTIKNCTVAGSSTSTTLATIAFSNGVITGNDGNTITNCTITSAGTNLPFNAIGSIGTSTAIDNSGISITNNNIQDYYSPGTPSNGILVASNSSAWTITGNKFFQSATRTSTSGNTHRAINIITASGGGYVITGNKIGYASATGTGVTTYAGGFANRFIGIELTAAATPVSNIQADTIAAISLSTTSGATTAPGIFSAISVLGGSVNIGTANGNLIGAASGTGSISITSSTSLPYISGIYARSTGTVAIQNNTIGAIITGGTASIGYTLNGINTAGVAGNFTVSGNTIGSTSTPNSISAGTNGTTTAVCKFNGIYNTASGTISITGNTIQNCSSFGSGASLFNGIAVDSAGATSALTITTNNILFGTSSGTNGFVGILNSAKAATADINNNIIRSNTVSSTSADFIGIENDGAMTTAINIKNNQLGNGSGGLVLYSVANSGTFFGIVNTDGATTAALTISGNNIQGITNSVASSGDHNYITNYTFTGSTTISSNTFTSLTVNTTGSITFISNDVTHDPGTTQTISNNSIVTGYVNTGVATDVFFYYSLSNSGPGVTEINSGNNFSNLAFTGATPVLGWISDDGSTPGSRKTITNNTFRNILTGAGAITVLYVGYSDNTYASNNISGNIISNINGALGITGIASPTQNQNFLNNTIDSLVSTGAGLVTGISISGGNIQNVSKNKIYYLSNANAGGSVNGLLISDGTTVTASNNYIGDLRAATATGTTDVIRGISITSTTNPSTYNLYYNTVYINATSSGTTFNTTGIFHAASTTAATATLNMRNNIIVNTSTPSGTGLTVAFRRSAGTAGRLANYASTSNNNLFYAGTPSANNLIYLDGASISQTMAAYKAGVFTAGTIAPRESASISENPTFLSTTGSSANFLHISTTVPTQIESGAINIPTFTNDYDNDIRQGNPGYAGTGTSPDIGADEFNGIAIDLTPPVISYTTLGNNACLTSDSLSTTITDGSGVNVAAGTKPRIWFKKKSNLNTLPGTNTNTTNGWKFVEASNSTSPYNLSINYSLIFGGVAVGDTIQYFVVAQDIVTPTPNIAINSGIFAIAPVSVALTATAFPIGGTINSYTILSGLSGTVTVGTGGTYTTLTGAGGLFSAINTNGLSGNLTANILGNITETGATPLNSISYGCSSNYTLTIKPGASVTATLSGSSATSLIKINGADYVTIDGSNSGTTSQDLTITNTNTGTSSAVVWLGCTATDGATHNTIKNCIIKGNSSSTTLAGIVSSSGITIGSAAESANFSNTYQNNAVNTAYYGIAVVGASTGDSSTVITSNVIGSATPANKIGNVGVFVSNQTNVLVSKNTISGITTSTTNTTSGITVAGASSGGTITTNKISDVKNTDASGYGSNGILLSATSTASNLTISNNMVYDIASYGYSVSDGSGDNGYGIIVDGGGGYNIYYNSVSMNTSQTADGLPAAFNVTSNITTSNSLNVRDNIFSNTQTMGTNRYAIICEAANTVFSAIDFNDYDAGTAPNLGYFGGSNVTNLAAWKTATGKDVSSISVAPVFTSATDLHLVVGSNCPIDHRATPITGITADIDNDVRDVTHPDIGADEFVNPSPILSSSLTPSAICTGTAFVYIATSVTSGATFAWVRDTIAGITEPGRLGTGNVNDTLTNTTSTPINVTYTYTTTATTCSNIQNVVVTVNPSPALSSTLTPPGICSGSTFSYTPTSGSTGASFTWTRAVVAGISNTAGTGTNNPNEVLTNTTLSPVSVTYVYTTSSNGCGSSGQNVVVTVSPVPALSSSLSPSVCSGSQFNYFPTSTTPGASFTWTRATVTGITQPGTNGTGNVNEILTNTTTAPINVTYAYAISANQCAGSTQNVVLSVIPLPTVSLAAFSSPFCSTAPAVTLTGGTPVGGTYAGAGVSSGSFNPATAGVGSHTVTYSVTTNGCTNAASQNATVQICTGIEENNFTQEITVYPNPTSGVFNIAIQNSNFNELLISIVDIQGKEVYNFVDKTISPDYNKQIDLKNLAKGLYYIKLSTDADVKIQKLVIE